MTEEETRQLRQAYAELQEEGKQKDRRIEELEGLLMRALLRIEELERQRAKDSHNSSKPPSSDGFARKVFAREKSKKPSGGQQGHEGHTLLPVASPDEVRIHRPSYCEQCHAELSQVPGQVSESRQVHEVPPVRLVVTEHRVETVACPACGKRTTATFPVGVEAPVQYGPRMQAFLDHSILLETLRNRGGRWSHLQACEQFLCVVYE